MRAVGGGDEQACPRVTYRTTSWAACDAALRRRGALLIWFDPQMEGLAVS